MTGVPARRGGVLRASITSGGLASIGSAIGLAVAARLAGKAMAQPLNATSHWLHGPAAARRTGIDAAHTGVGYATNHAASVFWAAIFQAWRARRPPAAPLPLLGEAAAMSAIAALVDYRATPKRFTPGWEFVLPRSGMAIAYAGLALGLAAGALLEQRGRDTGWN